MSWSRPMASFREMSGGLRCLFLCILLLLFLAQQADCLAEPTSTIHTRISQEVQLQSQHVHEPSIPLELSHVVSGEPLVKAEPSQPRVREPTVKVAQVPVYLVTLLTIAMAAATGLGSLPFFFMKIDESWSGLCNGIACGVMISASFDLISEGQAFKGGSAGGCVVLGIIVGGLFIVASQKFLEQFGDVKMMDVKGASARRLLLIVAIMTLHSFGEGSGVGVSFAGPRGWTQGLLVTLAIAVHNVPEGLAITMIMAARGVRPRDAMLWAVFTSLPQPLVAVPAFLAAHSFSQFLPFCVGFAAGCMIWIVLGEILPECIKEGADASQVATAATVSVAFMEGVGTFLEAFQSDASWKALSPVSWSLLFFLTPLLAASCLLLVSAACRPHSALLSGLAAGAVFALALCQPLQLLLAHRVALLSAAASVALGVALFHAANAAFPSLRRSPTADLFADFAYAKPVKSGSLSSAQVSPVARFLLAHNVNRAAVLATLAVAGHALAEGLLVGQAAAPRLESLGMRMLLPSTIHSIPRGVAIAAAVLGALGGGNAAAGASLWAVLAASVVSMAGLAGVSTAFMFGRPDNDASVLTLVVLCSCGFLFSVGSRLLMPKAFSVGKRRAVVGALGGAIIAVVCLYGRYALCTSTSFCSLAPEAFK